MRMTRRRIAVMSVAVLAVTITSWWVLLLLEQTAGYGGPQGPWDEAWWTIRGIVRTSWAGATGQPLTRDLFP
jgi:hypothetical protein